MSHIVTLLLDRIRDHMTLVLRTNIPANDPCRVDEVKIGRYQQNPSAARLRVAVEAGDLDDMTHMDGILPRVSRNTPIAFEMHARELGGTQFWYRRGIVQVEMFFTNLGLSEETARDRAYIIMGRVECQIEQIDLTGLVDSNGEFAHEIFMTASQMIQSGGPPSSWVFRGKCYWDCLTERNL